MTTAEEIILILQSRLDNSSQQVIQIGKGLAKAIIKELEAKDENS